jgi:hypothetical protein
MKHFIKFLIALGYFSGGKCARRILETPEIFDIPYTEIFERYILQKR